MKISMLTTGRFWMCDLARELDAQGHEVTLHSVLPKMRTRKFGLPDRCSRSMFLRLLPKVLAWYAANRYGSSLTQESTNEALIEAADEIAAREISPCDVFIGISGVASKTARVAKEKYKARVLIERGNQHILTQKEILEGMPGTAQGAKPVSDFAVRRELQDYDVADIIVVPSLVVEKSFVARGFDPRRIVRMPYGVSLDMFPPTPAPEGPPTVLMVGKWSRRKGCDILVEAWSKLKGVRLLHVGSVDDLPLPTQDGFEHHSPVEQARLRDFYARGHVFALASQEEGLALVQVQALACGLPLVCTDRTGGEDLRQFVEDPRNIAVAPHNDIAAFSTALKELVERTCNNRNTSVPRNLMGGHRADLSWHAYGERYQKEVLARI